ncbi:MAG TPA: substrate-binding domain-containing protein [Solirubrobacteraceae bacterium]|nr:substrate-binding domain-containing protein [Solirubrobacteraceae bacterium]
MRALIVIAVAAAASLSPVLPGAEYQIAVVPKGTTHEYWKSIEAGAMKAQRELASEGIPVNIIWKGPLREDDREQQIQVVENFVGRNVSAIVLAPLDSRALVAPVEEAVRAGIPVVVIDSGLNSKLPSSTVATDNRKGGQIGARRLGALLGGKGRAVMLRYEVGSDSTEQREAGFLEVMKSEFPAIALISTDQYGGATTETAYRAAQNLLNRFGDQMDGVFAPNESTANGMLLALRETGLAGKVRFVGFDANEQLAAALRQGDVQGLVVQDPLKMGYLGVMTVVSVLRHEAVADSIDTGVGLVTRENMDDPAVSALIHPPLSEYLK